MQGEATLWIANSILLEWTTFQMVLDVEKQTRRQKKLSPFVNMADSLLQVSIFLKTYRLPGEPASCQYQGKPHKAQALVGLT